jgi:hypothetical protein
LTYRQVGLKYTSRIIKRRNTMNGRRNAILVCAMVGCLVISAGVTLAAQTPKSEKEIPIVGGAARDAAAEAELMEQAGEDPGSGSGMTKVYRAGASPEEVFNFYLQKIGGKEGVSWDGDPAKLAKDGTSPVSYELYYYDEEDLTDWTYEGQRHPGKWVKETLSKNRKPLKPGMWIKEAKFFWSVRNPDGGMSDFGMNILDIGFGSIGNPQDYQSKKYKTGTGIEVYVSTSQSEEAMREESWEEMEEETAARTKALKGKPPTEKDLGVPIYPGAAFNAEASAGMSLGDDYAMFVYLSNDQPAKVAAFYEQKLKKKAEKAGSGYMIPIKGKPPVPEEGIVIQPNTMFGGSAKTVISIQKMVGEAE